MALEIKSRRLAECGAEVLEVRSDFRLSSPVQGFIDAGAGALRAAAGGLQSSTDRDAAPCTPRGRPSRTERSDRAFGVLAPDRRRERRLRMAVERGDEKQVRAALEENASSRAEDDDIRRAFQTRGWMDRAESQGIRRVLVDARIL